MPPSFHNAQPSVRRNARGLCIAVVMVTGLADSVLAVATTKVTTIKG